MEMTMTVEWKPSDFSVGAVFEAAKPPAILKRFNATLSLTSEPTVVFVLAELRCGTCDREAFRIGGYPRLMTEGNGYGLESGTTLWLPPHRLVCAECGASAEIFDPRRHGYDGAVVQIYFGDVGEGEDELIPGRFKVSVDLAYNAEWAELVRLSEDTILSPLDLFDWFTLRGSAIDCGDPIELDYECA